MPNSIILFFFFVVFITTVIPSILSNFMKESTNIRTYLLVSQIIILFLYFFLLFQIVNNFLKNSNLKQNSLNFVQKNIQSTLSGLYKSI